MEKIFSKVEAGKLLHFIIRRGDFVDGRVDLIGPDQFLQCAMLKHDKGKTFPPHKHIYKEEQEFSSIAQEMWIVVKGWVRVFHYDIDGTLLNQDVLGEGDMTCTLYGGHTYEFIENDSRVYEIKNGPYFGQQKDKVFL